MFIGVCEAAGYFMNLELSLSGKWGSHEVQTVDSRALGKRVLRFYVLRPYPLPVSSSSRNLQHTHDVETSAV